MYTPKRIFATKHHCRDLGFLIPEPDVEVNYTQTMFEKRQETVLKWATESAYSDGKRVEFGKNFKTSGAKWSALHHLSFENTPSKGFKLITLNGRYRTETEYLIVEHPNGFQFEVPFANVLEVIHLVGCGVGGILCGELYLQYGTKWKLVVNGSEMDTKAIEDDKNTRLEYLRKNTNKSTKLTKGDVVYVEGFNGLFVYVGKHTPQFTGNVNYIKAKQEHIKDVGFMYNVTYVGIKDIDIQHNEGKRMVFVRYDNSSCEGITSLHKAEEFNKKYSCSSEINGKDIKAEVILFKSKSVKINPIGKKDLSTLNRFKTKKHEEEFFFLRTWNVSGGFEKYFSNWDALFKKSSDYYKTREDFFEIFGSIKCSVGTKFPTHNIPKQLRHLRKDPYALRVVFDNV